MTPDQITTGAGAFAHAAPVHDGAVCLCKQWNRFLAALCATGYDFVVSIEHEDRQFEGTEAPVKPGCYLARNVLAPLMV